MSKSLPPRPSLDHLKNQAKQLVKAHRVGDAEACERIRRHLPRLGKHSPDVVRKSRVSLQEAQHVVACEYGFRDWKALVGHTVTPGGKAPIKAQLGKTLEATNFPDLGSRYKGKVRDCYTRDGRRTIVVTDRISAFDVVLGTIPFKGQVLNQIAAHWFDATKHIAPNHVLSVPDPAVMIATECTVLPVEFVFRAYMTGVTTTSIWYHYQRGVRQFCGHMLPDGLKKNQRLEKAILTPSTKAGQGGHDQSVSREEILATGIISAKDFDEAAAMCTKVFSFGQEAAAKRGLILVDTKYEIGRKPDGSLCFVDEVHTPDSSRYWYADDYQARFDRGEEPRGLDKEYVRRTLAEGGYVGNGPPPPLGDEIRCEAARRYIALYELITGKAFVPDTDEPMSRIQKRIHEMTAVSSSP